jgi:transcriptional regulator with XRE-family HTH domain
MQTTSFDSLRDLVLHFAAAQGWHTQRHVAVACGLDESALSRFLNGEQDIGARRTHALFRAVGVPVDLYNTAYALLGRAQDLAGSMKGSRRPEERRPGADGATPRRSTRFGEAGGGRMDMPPRPQPSPYGGGAYTPASTGSLGVVAPGHWTAALGADPGSDVPAAVAVALFAARSMSGEEIAAFFGG